MGDYHSTKQRPNKAVAISRAIEAGFRARLFRGLFEQGMIYYTLGGVQFNDLKLFYNVFNDRIQHVVSYEDKPDVFKQAQKIAGKLHANRYFGKAELRVMPGDIFDSDLQVIPRNNLGLVLFLDLTEFLTLDHQGYFQRWIFGHSLIPGDLIYVTSSLPPWVLIRGDFRKEMEPILKGYGALPEQLAEKRYWKEHYIRILLIHFSEKWRYYQLSRRSFRHFYGEIYRDTKFEMALNAFVVI